MKRDARLNQKVRPTLWRSESGQATTEYILLIAVVTGFYMIAFRFLNTSGFGKNLTNAVTTSYQSAYTYGYPCANPTNASTCAKGFDDGGPLNHPRAVGGTGNFRIFINPDKQ